MPSLNVEIVRFRPRAQDRIEPFLGEVVAQVVLALRDAEHFKFALVPADHQVDAEAALADEIRGGERLRCNQGMEQRRVDRAEHGEMPGCGEKPGCPGDGFE